MPHIYEEYLRVIYEMSSDNICNFDDTLFIEQDSNEIVLSIKNYKMKGGFSDFIFTP